MARLRGEIARAAAAHKRHADSIRLVAVSKTFPLTAVAAAYHAGQRLFGENYVAEALDKIAGARGLGLAEIEWHYIGPVQSNKTGKIAAHFAWVHSLHSEKHAVRLSRHRAGLPPLNVCVQVNISGEASKAGVAPATALALAAAVRELPNLKLRGVMGIPRRETDPARQRAAFAALAAVYQETRQGAAEIDTLSMGMSGDMGAAIAEGATMLRIGSAIFGPRL